jgi:TolB protein
MNLKSVFTSMAGAAVLALSMAAFAPTVARAQIEVDIDKGAVKPLPVAIPAFSGAGGRGADISQVISGNLERSGLFQPLNVANVADKLTDVNVQPRFPDWQATGAQALINGQVTVGADGVLARRLPPVGHLQPAAAAGPAVHLDRRELAARGPQDQRRGL